MTAFSDSSIEEILARALTEPSFLAELIDDCEAALKPYRIDPEIRSAFSKTNFQQLRRFSGFIGKVQHNYLWDSFPATRRLLQWYKLELDVFAGYRPVQLSSELRAKAQPEKIRRFATYLLQYTNDRPELDGLAAVIRYERACWELREAAATHRMISELSADTGDMSWSEFQRLVPAPIGPLRIERFDCNPASLAASVLNETFMGYRKENARLFLLLHDPRKMLLRILEVEELQALLLSYIDGKRSVRAVIEAARRQALAAAPPRAFRSFFHEATMDGFIALQRAASCA